MTISFEIIDISIDKNRIENVLIISFSFEHLEKNIKWKFEKAYDSIMYYLNDLVNKIPNISQPPLFSQCNNNIEIFKPKLKEYLNNLFIRKEIYKLFSFQKFFEFPDELIETQIITIDILSNITEYNILDYYFNDPYLFISCGNSNSFKALSFFFSYFEVKGFYLTYKLNEAKGSYGEKKLTEISKKENEKYITKIKNIKNFLFLGYNNGDVDIINFDNDKKEPSLYSTIENNESRMSINENYRINNIFYQHEKGLLYTFIEKDKKVCIYEINNKQHYKDILLTESPIIYTFISFSMNRIFVIDSYGTFWMYELFQETSTVKLLQASYTKLYNISTSEIFNEKNNDQTVNIFIGESNKVYLYQYSNKNNNFILKLTCDAHFKIKSIIYLIQYKCLLIGCDNGTIQIWKDSSNTPEYIIESGYTSINKLLYDEKNKYIFINNNKDLKILEINIDKILINENGNLLNEEKNKINVIAETLKDEDDKVAENNIRSIGKAFQTPIKEENKKDKNQNENLISISKEKEDDSDIDKNEYNYEVRNIDILDGWDEW